MIEHEEQEIIVIAAEAEERVGGESGLASLVVERLLCLVRGGWVRQVPGVERRAAPIVENDRMSCPRVCPSSSASLRRRRGLTRATKSLECDNQSHDAMPTHGEMAAADTPRCSTDASSLICS
jgi:hypothetical protein